MKNGKIWQDLNGNDIQAHGGCIINYGGKYYWYGENKGQDNCPGATRVDVIGISCYSSDNLVDWKYEGLVLKADKTDEKNPLHTSKVVERPKVLYNSKTNEFVMFLHLDNADYNFSHIGIAVCDKPDGEFELVNVCQPNNHDSQDMTVFADDDGSAYLIHTKDRDATINIDELTDDYKSFTGLHMSAMIDQYREAPAVCKYEDTYYMVTSGCTCWEANSALYSKSSDIMSDWRLIENPCVGENYRLTFNGQCSYIFKADGKYYIMLDHWIPDNLQKSGYSILPIEFENGKMTVAWKEEWLGI